MKTMTETVAVEREITIAASAETIWPFFVDPAKAIRWMGRTATLDPRPGGIYHVDVVPGFVAKGSFVEVDPPHRIAWTWGWEPTGDARTAIEPGSTTVEIELVPADADTTIVRLTHTGLAAGDSAANHGHGWEHYLGRLAIAATGGDPGPDTMATAA
jgi:uncharacterized protein YndB with AHSA1/START domain